MASHLSDSSSLPPSSTFDRLDERIRRWIWERHWTELRDVQEAAIEAILDGDGDLLITAATASGKTEAAFLPLCSRLAATPAPGIRALYVSPLKALINDQYGRLDDICERLDLPVHRWHGDVPASRKQALLRDPHGILLITPESLEALFVVRGPSLKALFAGLEAVVADEVHSFIGRERGKQLQSLLHRLEVLVHRRLRRVGLSATLGDLALAAEFLRPGAGAAVRVIVSTDGAQELRLQVRGYEERPGRGSDGAQDSPEADPPPTVHDAMARHLFDALRGSDNLVFANSRQLVEFYADKLREACDQAHVPNVFWPHHGSLAKAVREEVEAALKDKERAVTVVCTSTLELGIDIGSVTSIAQIGPPPSVASLRQRLGRSGRRGAPAVLRVYLDEEPIEPGTPPQDQLRAALVQSIAMVQLLLEGWCEPPDGDGLHLSTLVQQLLSLIAQYGGVRADGAWRVLCEAGPFRQVGADVFARLLRRLGEREVLTQADDGTLLLGPQGERIVSHHSFFSAFATPEEYRVVSASHELGTLPLLFPLAPGMYLIFAGRRWRVEAVDDVQRVVDVAPAASGRVPRFFGSGSGVHTCVRERMRAIYEAHDVPVFLDPIARRLLAEARAHYARLGVHREPLVAWGTQTLVFCFTGDRVQETLALQLAARGLAVTVDGLALGVAGVSPDRLADHLRDLAEAPSSDPIALARLASNKRLEKYDDLLDDDLLCLDYASRRLAPADAHQVAVRLSAACQPRSTNGEEKPDPKT